MVVLGGWAFCYEQGTPVLFSDERGTPVLFSYGRGTVMSVRVGVFCVEVKDLTLKQLPP